MKKLLAMAYLVCAVGTADAQVGSAPSEVHPGTTWEYQDTRLNCLYKESTPSGYYLPSAGPSYADDIHLGQGPPGTPWGISGLELWYHSRTTAANVPCSATVRFYANDSTDTTFSPLLYSYTITGLGTGTHYVYGEFGELVPLPAGVNDLWMEVTFTPVDQTTGLLIAGDFQAEVGITSHDLFEEAYPPGNFSWPIWFGGYTPDLPNTNEYWNPPGNFLLGLYGRSVPEPLALGLLALGGWLVLPRRQQAKARE